MDGPGDQFPPPDAPGSEPKPEPGQYPGPIRLLLLLVLAPAIMALGWGFQSGPLLVLPAVLEFFVVVVLSAELVALRRSWAAAGLLILGVLFSAFLLLWGVVLCFRFMPFSMI